METLLQVENLHTHFVTPRGLVRAVNGVDIRLHKGEILGIVGESGSGKSVMAQSLLRVVPKANRARLDGRVVFCGTDLMQLGEEAMRRVRGARIAMVTQNPSTSLNPVLTVGDQLLEAMRFHPDRMPDESRMRQRMLAMMNEVQLPTPSVIAKRYPFQLSGGMKQRISIAMALMCEPELLIADEPTTALDVTIQAQILELIRNARRVHGTSVIFITHDLGVVAQLCDTVAVMYGGKIVEYNSADEIFRNPRHPYTQGLLESNPVFGQARKRLHAMSGQPPDLATLKDGCAFAPRCSKALPGCHVEPPAMVPIAGHFRHMCPVVQGVGKLSA
jgi:oligopeptide/dipeptide ABC transporter ATP-binding protein